MPGARIRRRPPAVAATDGSFGSRSRRVGAFASGDRAAIVIESSCTSMPRWMIERAALGTAAARDDMGWSPCATDASSPVALRTP